MSVIWEKIYCIHAFIKYVLKRQHLPETSWYNYIYDTQVATYIASKRIIFTVEISRIQEKDHCMSSRGLSHLFY